MDMNFRRAMITCKPLFYVAFGFICGCLYTGNTMVYQQHSIERTETANTSQHIAKTDDGSKLPNENIDIQVQHSSNDESPQSEEELKQLYVREMRKVGYSCNRIKKWGGNSPKYPNHKTYGQKSVCLDQNVKPVPGNCIVYSFGIDEEWSFDIAARDYGCEVFSFDPSLTRNTSDYSKNIHFYRIGISDKLKDVELEGGVKWTLMGFKDIVKMLGHENRIIDIVKMDVERSEWDAIPRMIEEESMNMVKQFMLESHFQVHPPCYVVVRQMRQYGMEILFKEYRKCSTLSKRPCFETVWINKRFL